MILLKAIQIPKISKPKRLVPHIIYDNPRDRKRKRKKLSKRCQICDGKYHIKICILGHRICKHCRRKYRTKLNYDTEIKCVICSNYYIDSLVRENNNNLGFYLS